MKKVACLGALGVVALLAHCAPPRVETQVATPVAPPAPSADAAVRIEARHFEGTLAELPTALAQAGDALAQVTAKMTKARPDAPPAGNVKLSDLHPSFAKYEGKEGQDFLVGARAKDGTPIAFAYVRVGAPPYDGFFDAVTLLYALCWQATQVVHRLREEAAAALQIVAADLDTMDPVKGQVDKALASPGADPAIVAEMKTLSAMAQGLAVLVAEHAGRLGALVKTEEGLFAATQVPLVKEGLTDGVALVIQAARRLVGLRQDLAGYGV